MCLVSTFLFSPIFINCLRTFFKLTIYNNNNNNKGLRAAFIIFYCKRESWVSWQVGWFLYTSVKVREL